MLVNCVQRVLKKYIDVYDYKIAPTWWTLDRLRCPFDKLVMSSTYSVGGGRGVILSCNGIICAKLNYSIIVTNPVFHHDAILLDYPRCRISSVEKTYLSGMGFGCTRRNCNKFKVLLVESCVYTQ
ncbi:hypothetical protein LIER_32259 [Lithospermum erythrorhizon]|uniref:Uncharacterized protein n=1 Tax=Lithospermum erythrorhizon TaxID=34254 RepID=A0AAV3RTD2_LITER